MRKIGIRSKAEKFEMALAVAAESREAMEEAALAASREYAAEAREVKAWDQVFNSAFHALDCARQASRLAGLAKERLMTTSRIVPSAALAAESMSASESVSDLAKALEKAALSSQESISHAERAISMAKACAKKIEEGREWLAWFLNPRNDDKARASRQAAMA